VLDAGCDIHGGASGAAKLSSPIVTSNRQRV
jgi:hypothetical protein